MATFDPKKVLDAPVYALDLQFMVGDLKEFLSFSESNIEWQYRRELQAIAKRKDIEDCPSAYRDDLEQGAKHRFEVSLPLSVRYGALLALTTTVEWSVRLLNGQCRVPVLEKKGENVSVRLLRELCRRTSMSADTAIDDYEALVKVRNCIAHSAGILATYKHKDELPDAVNKLRGFSLESWNFLGDQVCIRQGALEPYVDQLAILIIDLHRAVSEQRLLEQSGAAPSL